MISIASFTGMLTARAQQITLPVTHAKFRVTQQLCRQLAIAFGEARIPKLTLVPAARSQGVARFFPKPEPELILDEKAYDLCRDFGSDSLSALAVLLGHELTHYYGKHTDWFGFAQQAGKEKATTSQAMQSQVLENQADIQGVFRAFVAGYDVYKLVRPLYTKIYKTYQLPDSMPGYPTREERIQSMERQAMRAYSLGMAFDVGLFFLLKSDYIKAERCFSFVAEEIPSKEILNNIGLCLLLRVAESMTLVEMPFRYPFEVDASNRLTPENHRGSEIDKADLLKQAISYFRQAIDLDEAYTPAYINLAAASSLLGRSGTAKETIDQLEDVLNKRKENLPPNARLVRVIALAEQDKLGEAGAELASITEAYSLAYNREALKNYARIAKLPSLEAQQEWQTLAANYKNSTVKTVPVKEQKLGNILFPLSAKTAFTDRMVIPNPDQIRIQSHWTSEAITYQIVCADSTYSLGRSLPGALVQTTQGIRSGDAVQALKTKYGEPQRIIPAGAGLVFYCYEEFNLFDSVLDDSVQNWFIYRTH